jgi:hypothetical protein
VSLHVAYVVERAAAPEAASPAAPTDSPEPPVPPSTPEAAPAASIEQPTTPKEEPPPGDDAPGAFMDVLSRAEAEAQAAALSGNKRKSS